MYSAAIIEMQNRIRRFDKFIFIIPLFFIFYFGYFISSNINSVDGSTRCFHNFHSAEVNLHKNNHLLYPFNLYLAVSVLEKIGVQAETPMEFFRLATIVNVICGALSLCFFYLILKFFKISSTVSLLCTLFLGFSAAYLTNATNPNEPMPGFFFSILSFYLMLIGLNKKSFILVYLSSFFLIYAMATYQSMFSVIVGITFYACIPALKKDYKKTFVFLSTYYVSVLVNTVIIYGLAYSLGKGMNSPAEMIQYFFSLQGAGDKNIWGQLNLKNIVLTIYNLPLMFLHLPFYSISQSFFNNPDKVVNLIKYTLSFCFTYSIILMTASFSYKFLIHHHFSRIKTILGLCTLLPCLLIVSFWAPSYSKLWLQPLAMIIFLCGLSYTLGKKYDYHLVKLKTFGKYYSVIILSIFALWNQQFLLGELKRGDLLSENIAKGYNDIVSKDAIVIMDWSNEAMYFKSLYPKSRSFVDFANLSINLDDLALSERIKSILESAISKNRDIYFVGLLDINELEWNQFYLESTNIPYEILNEYRNSSNIIQINGQTNRLFKVNKSQLYVLN